MTGRDRSGGARAWGLTVAVLAALAAMWPLLPDYNQITLARVMVFAIFAIGYNILFGYTGLLSLGHALFFAAGLYAAGLGARDGGLTAVPAFLAGILAGAGLAAGVGALALRTAGVAFMIVTLMFAQAGYLALLYFNEWTRGDEGFNLPAASRTVLGLELAGADMRYGTALALFALATLIATWLARSPLGRVMVAVRENEARAAMLGYDTGRVKLAAVTISGAFSGAAGAAYGLIDGYAGATFASVQYSILPLLWVLVGGAGTVLGPLVGAVFMFYLIDLTSGLTDAYLLVAGAVLVLVTLFAPRGIMGEVRRRVARWLP
ncbi:MAG: branched-chain amino acid ABC transporter permease [Paracoccaceae bacterium]|nr:MAG: branched-chain amino acid ABC transporter permease [Paracoccaceae bacterium]